MKTEVHEIDVNKARDFLVHNLPYKRGEDDTNRPISTRKVNQYARDMLRGDWKLTHQGIAFDVAGHLKDGQHRLLALVQAAEEGASEGEITIQAKPRIKIKFQVTWGLDNNTFDSIDVGLPRSAQQILAIAGYTNQTHLAAASRLLHLFDNHEYKSWRSITVTNHQVLDIVRKTNLDQYIPIATPLVPIGFIAPATTVGYYVCERAYPAGPNEEFIESLKTGAISRKDDPRLAIRNYMIRSKGIPRVRRDAHMHLALYIKAWNDYVENKRRTVIVWKTTNPFPKPIEK